MIAAILSLSGCAARSVERADRAGQDCRPGTVDNYMSLRWQQCWFTAPQGRWRTLDHDFHYDVLVVQAEASSLAAGEEIVRRWLEVHGDRFSEILVYVRAQGSPATVRRLRWRENRDIDSFEFTAAPDPSGATP